QLAGAFALRGQLDLQLGADRQVLLGTAVGVELGRAALDRELAGGRHGHAVLTLAGVLLILERRARDRDRAGEGQDAERTGVPDGGSLGRCGSGMWAGRWGRGRNPTRRGGSGAKRR